MGENLQRKFLGCSRGMEEIFYDAILILINNFVILPGSEQREILLRATVQANRFAEHFHHSANNIVVESLYNPCKKKINYSTILSDTSSSKMTQATKVTYKEQLKIQITNLINL